MTQVAKPANAITITRVVATATKSVSAIIGFAVGTTESCAAFAKDRIRFADCFLISGFVAVGVTEPTLKQGGANLLRQHFAQLQQG